MVKRKIDAKVMNAIREFVEKAGKLYVIDAVYLFGSHAKGTTNEWSDIDLAIVSRDIKNRLDDMVKLLVIAGNMDALIEPHPYNIEQFNLGSDNFVNEILRTGIRVA